MTRFARISKGPMGQYDTKIPGFKFYGEAAAILRQKAAKAPGGPIDLTELIRRKLLVEAYGIDYMTKLHRKQYESVSGKGSESGED